MTLCPVLWAALTPTPSSAALVRCRVAAVPVRSPLLVGVSSDVWSTLLQVDPGQPFRLDLWRTLALFSFDPDADLFRYGPSEFLKVELN